MKELIYLVIIVSYLAYKLFSNIRGYFKIYKLLGYKTIKVNGVPFVIKKISPLDFVETTNGFPMTLFEYKKSMGIYDQMMAESNKKDGVKELEQKLQLAKELCEKAVVYVPRNIKVESLFNINNGKTALDLAWSLYGKVLEYNFKYLFKSFQIPKNYAIHISELCAKYGKKPHEHIAGDAKLTSVESYMIDEFFYNILLEKENTQIKKQNEALEKSKQKKRTRR